MSTSVVTPAGYQFGRASSLVVIANGSANGDVKYKDLSALHFTFTVRASDVETPNEAEIRLYNAKPDTVNSVVNEFNQVVLQAGFGGQLATIFKGTVKQYRQGKEKNTDTFLDILAADSDELYNFGTVNQSIAGGSTPADRFNAICDSLGAPQDPNAQGYLGATGGVLPRGKVLFGLGRQYMRDIANSSATRWSFQNGAITLIPLTGYLPGTPVIIDGTSGMIGVPEATDQGVEVDILINPFIRIGQTVQINSKDIVQTAIKQQGYPNYSSISYIASVPPGLGTYRVMVAEHQGDTRGNTWYTHLTCLAVDPSLPANQSVAAYGGNQS